MVLQRKCEQAVSLGRKCGVDQNDELAIDTVHLAERIVSDLNL